MWKIKIILNLFFFLNAVFINGFNVCNVLDLNNINIIIIELIRELVVNLLFFSEFNIIVFVVLMMIWFSWVIFRFKLREISENKFFMFE